MKRKFFCLFIILTLLSGCQSTTEYTNETFNTELSVSEEITSYENMHYDYMQIGYEEGMHYKEICSKYFHTSALIYWEIDSLKDQFVDDKTDRHFTPIIGLKDDEEIIEMSYNDVQSYFAEMGISPNAFKQFQTTANGAYYDVDGQLYLGIIDGGITGWDCSYIKDYTIIDENTIQYNCIWIGYAENWSYKFTNDQIEEFTFTLKQENDKWMLYECSNLYAFCGYFKGFE